MTAEERAQLKEAVSAAQRAKHDADTSIAGRCPGCGGRGDSFTWDCVTCRERNRQRQRREVDRLKADLEHARDLLRDAHQSASEWREKHRVVAARLDAVLAEAWTPPARYQTDEERVEARRRTYRMSKRRARQAA